MIYGTPCLAALCLLWMLVLDQGFGCLSNTQGSPISIPTDGGPNAFVDNGHPQLFSSPYFPPHDPLPLTSDMIADYHQFSTMGNVMEMVPQVNANQVLSLANTSSDASPYEPRFDLAEYLNFDNTDDVQLTDPAGPPVPSTPNQPPNSLNPSGESDLNHTGNSSTVEASSKASVGVSSAQLGTINLGLLDPATRLNLLSYITRSRNSPYPVLPNPKRQRIGFASSTADINQPENQLSIPNVGQPHILSLLPSKPVSGSRKIDFKVRRPRIFKTKQERQEADIVIKDPNYILKYALGLCERLSQKAFARIAIPKSSPEEVDSTKASSLTKEAIEHLCSVLGGPGICEEIKANTSLFLKKVGCNIRSQKKSTVKALVYSQINAEETVLCYG
ncbi:hypothetical protein BJ085DRAFT_29383 [Dimargaris cristalligena]|uniref:Uncharacterized protein n=1 Tax=Dimargaris cristalligena TaxID=215637 RepID=A0A4V1J459_9FUNG|nr:hypothetical protein BJ085DRAFT_29383 [Dimargaris cristalligena]|eukprot:RKP34419.1 hypothetical protein BJ085DRAFT_29383 [Dimargaris cristalligena]